MYIYIYICVCIYIYIYNITVYNCIYYRASVKGTRHTPCGGEALHFMS